jgi:hypothetical protein
MGWRWDHWGMAGVESDRERDSLTPLQSKMLHDYG